MSNEFLMSSSAAQLLEHRDFVRAVAFAILRDAHDADDVAQEAMTRALARDPGPVESMRAWLAVVVRNLAFNLRRERTRRANRERIAAPAESVDRVDLTARMESRQRVVAAVLALDEPYRSVVLAHYDDGASIASIARQRGVPESTVRSLLFRGRERLRAKLEREFGGSHALGVALAPLVGVPTGAKVLFAAAAVVAVTLTFSLPTMLADDPTPKTSIETSPPRESSQAPKPAVVSEAADARNEPVGVRSSASDTPAAAPTVDEMLAHVVALRDELRRRLLTPAAASERDLGDRLRAQDGGVARILDRTRYGFGAATGPGEILGMRGGGAFFSFTRRDNVQSAEADLGFQRGEFFADHGRVLPLGDVPIEGLVADPAAPPAGLGARTKEAWSMLLGPIDPNDQLAERTMDQFLRERKLDDPPRVEVGTTYLVRSTAAYGHDIAAVARPLAIDEDGVTFAWRLLRVFRTAPVMTEPMLADPMEGIAPAVLSKAESAAPTAELVDAICALRSSLSSIALGIDDATRARIRGRFTSPDVRVARLITHRALHGVTVARMGGTTLNLVGDDGDGPGTNDLRLEAPFIHRGGGIVIHTGTSSAREPEGPKYVSNPGGTACSVLLDVGNVSLDGLEGYGPDALGLTGKAAELLTFLREHDATTEEPGERSQTFFRALMKKNPSAIRDIWTLAIPGHTYLVRSMVDADRDVLAAFTYVEDDAYGQLIAWRVLKTWRVRKNR